MVSTIVGSYYKAIGVVALVQHVLSWQGLTYERVGLVFISYIVETSKGIVVSKCLIPGCLGTLLPWFNVYWVYH